MTACKAQGSRSKGDVHLQIKKLRPKVMASLDIGDLQFSSVTRHKGLGKGCAKGSRSGRCGGPGQRADPCLLLRRRTGVAVWEASWPGGVWGPGSGKICSHSQRVCLPKPQGVLSPGNSQAVSRQPHPRRNTKVPSSGVGTVSERRAGGQQGHRTESQGPMEPGPEPQTGGQGAATLLGWHQPDLALPKRPGSGCP